ncbi:hypothetical protein BsWGS_05319 [Bradybaena similaris]
MLVQARKLPSLEAILAKLCNRCKITMQWIPSHCGVPGNERPAQDDYYKMDRPEQVILRTGHNRLSSHMYTKFRIGDSAMWTCGLGPPPPQTAEHILRACPKYNLMRQAYWPRETTVETKLYGPLNELKQTVKFIQETTLQI